MVLSYVTNVWKRIKGAAKQQPQTIENIIDQMEKGQNKFTVVEMGEFGEVNKPLYIHFDAVYLLNN